MKILIFILFYLSIILIAQENKYSGTFSGYMIGDYYYNIKNHNAELIDQHGFWFRRIYFTYDYTINSHFSTRLRLEMNNDGGYEDAEVITPFIKDAYLAYKFGNQKAYFGISSPPTFSLIEKIWGYRSVEKTPLDLQRMANSRDFGLALKGQFDSAGKYRYHVMLGNGSGNKQEIDKGKSLTASLSFWATKEIVLQIYGDYADRVGRADTYISQAFIGYKRENLHGGFQYSHQTLRAKDNSIDDNTLSLFSIFLSGNIFSNIKLIGRIDKTFEANHEGGNIDYTPFDDSSSFTMFIVGVDFNVADGVSIIPNVKFVTYDVNDLGVTPAEDLYAWLTLFWKFK